MRKLLSTASLGSAVVATGVVFGASNAQAATTYWHGCTATKYNHHGAKYGGTGYNTHNSAETSGPCSRATRQGIPCGGLTVYEGPIFGSPTYLNCPTVNTDFVSSNRGSQVNSSYSFAVLTRLCGSCAGLKFSSEHITTGISYFPGG